MTFDPQALYGLLPAVQRTRDAAEGGPLEALLTVIAEQALDLEESIEQLYDDQFIETCAEWAVPYIADLVGHRPLDPQLQARLGSARAEVANTIRFRRRKGTAAVLEELALDITGWDAAVVELFRRLATTEHLNHRRPGHPGFADLRRPPDAAAPFDRLARNADVRRTDGAGRPNIPNVAIFLWRVGSRRLTDAPAFALDDRRFRFDPLGSDLQLYNAAERATEVTRLAGPLDVPLPITRRGLREHLDEFIGPGRSLTVQRGDHVLGAGEVEACDLSDVDGGWAHSAQARVAIDPVLGRIMFPEPVAEPVRVTFHHASVADIGGGEYDRTPPGGDVAAAAERHVPGQVATIAQALDDLDGSGAVVVTGSGTYEELPALAAAEDSRLALRAANGSRPLLRLTGGDLVVGGGDSGEVTIDGLLIAGGRVVVPAQVGGQPNRLQRLRLVDCTLVPGAGESLEVAIAGVSVELERCITGAIRLAEGSDLSATESIVDATAPEEIVLEAPDGGSAGRVTLDSVTVVGKVRTTELTATDAILHAERGAGDSWPAAVIAERGQAGYLRFSYAPLDAQLPPRYRCRPAGPDEGRMVPRFTATEYGRAGYLQLARATPRELRCGASDGGEMGAYHGTFAPQRVAGVRLRLDEYLRFGLEAGLIFAS